MPIINHSSDNGVIKEFNSLGEYLKYIREKKALSIDDVVADTRIRKIYIEALEQDDYPVLPERTYALGYLRSYANFLEIRNVDELVQYLDGSFEFINPAYSNEEKIDRKNQSDHGEAKGNDDEATKQGNVSAKKSQVHNDLSVLQGGMSSRPKKINKYVLIVAFVIIVLLVVVISSFFMAKKDPVVEKEDVAEEVLNNISEVVQDQDFVAVDKSQVANVEENKQTENNQAVVENKKEEGNLQKQQQKEAQESNTKNIVITKFPAETMERNIKIVFVEDVWLQINDTNNSDIIYLDRIFKAGQTYEVPGVENISADVGNYKGLYFLVDNKRVDLSSKRRSLVINSIKLDGASLLEKYN